MHAIPVRWKDSHERTWEPEANLTKALVSTFEEEQLAKGLGLRGTDQPSEAEEADNKRRWSQGGLRGDGPSTSGEERYKVLSFGGDGKAREEAFVATIEEAKAIAEEGDVIEDTAQGNGVPGALQDGNGKVSKVSELVAPPELAG